MNKNTIRVRANIVVIRDNKILLVPHFIDDNKIIWYLPGGKVEFGEKLKQAAAREFREETGLKVKVNDLVNTFELIEPEKPWHSIRLIYEGEITGGSIKAENHPVYGLKKPRWFSEKEIREIRCRPSEVIKEIMKSN